MEVHHHPHVEKKSFKEYFLEFIMIFLAVTMGFFAESLRENITEHHREKQYMQSMLEDLKNDTSMLTYGYHKAFYVANGMDSLKRMLYNDPADINVPELYRLQIIYSVAFGLTFDDRTSSQLKTGGMNFIKNLQVASAISNYWLGKNLLLDISENISAKMEHIYQQRYAIFNFKYANIQPPDSGSYILHATINPQCRLLSTDSALLTNYANQIYFAELIVKYNYATHILKQYKSAADLIILIQKEYDLK